MQQRHSLACTTAIELTDRQTLYLYLTLYNFDLPGRGQRLLVNEAT
jgi:hypothetical protein